MKIFSPSKAWFLIIIWTVICSNSIHADTSLGVKKALVQSITQLNEQIQKDFIQGDVSKIIQFYTKNVIFMPEYQPTLNGVKKIEDYFDALNTKRKMRKLVYTSEELINLDTHILEIGGFEAEIDWLTDQNNNTRNYTGKYWRIWHTDIVGGPKVMGEAFGFFKRLQNPELWVTDMSTWKNLSPRKFKPADASLELKAYAAFGREGVKKKMVLCVLNCIHPMQFSTPLQKRQKKASRCSNPTLLSIHLMVLLLTLYRPIYMT